MATEILTTDDLYDFKVQLFGELKKLLAENPHSAPKKYLKSAEVMEMLQVSPGTLQNLRINGTLDEPVKVNHVRRMKVSIAN